MQRKTITNVIVVFWLAFMGWLLLQSEPVSAYTVSISTANSISLDTSPAGGGTSISEESVNVISDCSRGYHLSIGTSGDNNLYAGGDSTGDAVFSVVDGVSSLNSSNNANKWGYTLTNGATGATIFSPLSTTASVIRTPAQTISEGSIDDTFSIYYGVQVDDSVAPGTYQMASGSTIVYYVTVPTCTHYAVSYNSNGGTGTINDQYILPDVTTRLTSADGLAAPVGSSYTDAGNNVISGDANKLWVFWGWNTEIDGTGDWYKDGEEVLNLESIGNTVMLYAQWKQATLVDLTAGVPLGSEKVINHNTMQDMHSAVCWNSNAYSHFSSRPAHTPYNASTNPDGYHTVTLLDYRGKVTTGGNPESPETYTVSKLEDGLCWMSTNLNLGRDTGGPNGDGTITLTPDDTDITENFTLPAGTMTSSNVNTAARIRTTNNNGTNANGVYYSWAAAVANTTSMSSTPATSICPKNWDLPTESQFVNLISKGSYSSSNKTTAAPSSFVLNGGYANGASFETSSNSYYWASTTSSTSSATGISVAETSISRSYSYSVGSFKYYEKNVRCVANMDKASYTINFVNTFDGSTQDIKIVFGESGKVSPLTAWTRSGYEIIGWDVVSNDGSGSTGSVVYTNDQTVTLSSDITIYTVWRPTYIVQYDGNGSDNDATGMGTADGTGVKTVRQYNVAESNTFDLFASNFKRDGYGFVGWSTDANAWSKLTDNDSTNDAKIWGPNEVITAPAYSGPILTLFAVWAPAATNGGTPVYLQDWNGCSNMTATVYDSDTGALTVASNSIIALTDERDGQVYAVAKLADGVCWMIENLRLADTHEEGGSTVATTLSTSNTNILSNNSSLPLTNIYNADPLLATTSNSLSPSSSQSSSDDPDYGWCDVRESACYNQSRLDTSNTTVDYTPSITQNINSDYAHTNFYGRVYSYGNYYNWYSATAGYGTYELHGRVDVDGDLCPAGWKLPYGSDRISGNQNLGNKRGGYYYLADHIGAVGQDSRASSRKFRKFPNNFVYSGEQDGGTIKRSGEIGIFPSSTAYSNVMAFNLYVETSVMNYESAYGEKSSGFSVRCVTGL